MYFCLEKCWSDNADDAIMKKMAADSANSPTPWRRVLYLAIAELQIFPSTKKLVEKRDRGKKLLNLFSGSLPETAIAVDLIRVTVVLGHCRPLSLSSLCSCPTSIVLVIVSLFFACLLIYRALSGNGSVTAPGQMWIANHTVNQCPYISHNTYSMLNTTFVPIREEQIAGENGLLCPWPIWTPEFTHDTTSIRWWNHIMPWPQLLEYKTRGVGPLFPAYPVSIQWLPIEIFTCDLVLCFSQIWNPSAK